MVPSTETTKHLSIISSFNIFFKIGELVFLFFIDHNNLEKPCEVLFDYLIPTQFLIELKLLKLIDEINNTI